MARACAAVLGALRSSREAPSFSIRGHRVPCGRSLGESSAPFITDDARVVGKHQAQVESWVRWDKVSVQHWVVPAWGPIAPLELTMGGLHGSSAQPAPRHYSFAAPLLQAKLLLHAARPDGAPGVAVIGGAFLPFGSGGFRSPPAAYVYLAATQVFGDDAVLLHANVGIAGARIDERRGDGPGIVRRDRFRIPWGVGSQVHVASIVNAVLEVYSGDPYAEVSGGAMQGGMRFSMSQNVQLDLTGGTGLWGGDARMAAWVSSGIRVVSNRLY